MLKSEFYARDAVTVAKELLGKILVHETQEGIIKGMIVETEAYYGEFDPGSHAFGGKRTKRNEVMWGPPGYAYVYFTYGMHYMLNVVTGKEGEAGAVLIRAVEPLEGIDLMVRRRKFKGLKDDLINLTNGPAKLTQAFGIDKRHNSIDIVNSNLRIVQNDSARTTTNRDFGSASTSPTPTIVATTRIGIKNDSGEKLRFYIADNKYVSMK